MNLDGESWGFSFVKQAQYQQQGVIAFEKHQAAKRSIKTFQQLLKIVEVFPHYFAGLMLTLNKMSMSIIKRVCNNFH
ncbi:galactose-1-phosphate uridylyltransferase [Enterococcus faecalis]|nr:galactose-1-phosphate uridylyltransferase [Enterococcus faecalis]